MCSCPQATTSILKTSLSCIYFPTQLIFSTDNHHLYYYSDNLKSALELQRKVKSIGGTGECEEWSVVLTSSYASNIQMPKQEMETSFDPITSNKASCKFACPTYNNPIFCTRTCTHHILCIQEAPQICRKSSIENHLFKFYNDRLILFLVKILSTILISNFLSEIHKEFAKNQE